MGHSYSKTKKDIYSIKFSCQKSPTPRKIEKGQNKLKENNNIRAEINEIETNKTRKSMKQRSYSLKEGQQNWQTSSKTDKAKREDRNY